MKTAKMLTILVVALGLMVCSARVSEAQPQPIGTAFTYQGFLRKITPPLPLSPADDPHDFRFRLFDDPCAGTQVSDIVTANDVNVIEGYFMVRLDFGADVFAGYERWLQIDVRETGSGDLFTPLTPRLELTLTPYAIYALSAEDANTVDGHHANAFAASVHNHDGVYAPAAHDHNDRYYTETELQTSGDANVHWDNLLATMPGGFADGVDNVGGGVPPGVIVMWAGTIDGNGNPVVDGTADNNWQICDGTNGTPDLTSSFIRSVPNASTDPGSTGGSTTHTHGVGSYTASSHTHPYSGTTSQANEIEWCQSGDKQVPARITHTHTYSGTTYPGGGGGSITGTSTPESNLPPYYELAFIMFIGGQS